MSHRGRDGVPSEANGTSDPANTLDDGIFRHSACPCPPKERLQYHPREVMASAIRSCGTMPIFRIIKTISGGSGPISGSVHSRPHNAHGADASIRWTVSSRATRGESCSCALCALCPFPGPLCVFFCTFAHVRDVASPPNKNTAAADQHYARHKSAPALLVACGLFTVPVGKKKGAIAWLVVAALLRVVYW